MRRPDLRGNSYFVVSLLLSFLLLSASPSSAEPDGDVVWTTIVSDHFEVISAASPEVGVEIAAGLERLHRTFAQLSPGLRLRTPLPLRIVAFPGHELYAPYKSPSDLRILGQFISSLDGHYLTIDASRVAEGDLEVVYHEYVHHLVAGNFPALPRWFNEGLAEYYSTVAFREGTAYVGFPVERHVAWILAHNKKREKVLAYDFSLYDVLTGEAAHDSRVGGFYAFSWALVHHLLSGGGDRLERAADYLARLTLGEDPEEAFEDAFEMTFRDLEKTLSESVKQVYHVSEFPLSDDDMTEPSTSPTRIEDVLLWLGDLTARLGRGELAQRHYDAILERTPEHADAHAGLAALLDLESRFDEASVMYADALQRGPTEPRAYLRYGRHLLARLQPGDADFLRAAGKLALSGAFAPLPGDDLFAAEERAAAEALAGKARNAFAKALDLDPGHAGAQVYFGVSHLYGDVDPKPGIKVLQRVRHWLPDDQALVFNLLQLHLKAGEFKAAEALAARAVNGNDLELVQRARTEIDRAVLLSRSSKAFEKGEIERALRLFDEAIEETREPDLREQMIERYAGLQERYAGDEERPDS